MPILRRKSTLPISTQNEEDIQKSQSCHKGFQLFKNSFLRNILVSKFSVDSNYSIGPGQSDNIMGERQQYQQRVLLPTAYVVRPEGYVLTRVFPSVCPHPHTGGTPARSRWGGGTQARPSWGGGGGYPCQGGRPPWVPPHRTWLGGGIPHLRYPPHWTWPGGVPLLGGGSWVTPPKVIDGVLDTPRSVCLLRSRRRTFLVLY